MPCHCMPEKRNMAGCRAEQTLHNVSSCVTTASLISGEGSGNDGICSRGAPNKARHGDRGERYARAWSPFDR